MAQPKCTIYKYVGLKDGSWRYCRAALYANHTIKPDVVTVEAKTRNTRRATIRKAGQHVGFDRKKCPAIVVRSRRDLLLQLRRAGAHLFFPNSVHLLLAAVTKFGDGCFASPGLLASLPTEKRYS